MKHSKCGCTLQRPGSGCEVGQEVFAAADQAFKTLVNMPVIARDGRWIAYNIARLAYLDHLNGWREGDLKVRREVGIWMVYTRLCGQWVFWFGTREDAILSAWLKDRGYQQYVQIKGDQPEAQRLGYYRKQTMEGSYIEERVRSTPSLQPDNQDLLAERASIKREEEAASGSKSTPQLDLKTRVAIQVALLVTQFSRPLTVVDRLYVQRRTASLLLSHGIQVRSGDEHTIAVLLDEAIQQKEDMNISLEHATKPLQE